MYEAHFGLQGRPFDTGIAHEVDVFRGARQNAIVDKTKLALAASDSVVTFFGPPGVGKTKLALSAVRSTTTRLALAWLSSMPSNANELLELLLVELGINAHRATRIERLQMWRQYLDELRATESRVFVIAERTEELPPEVLRALDSLTGADASGSPGANVVLLGHQGLDAFLSAPSLESLRQRIRLRQRVEPFSQTELAEYLRHRVTQAGGDFDRLFAPGAAAAVYRHSGGVARLANTLCEAALTGAAAAGQPALTSALVAQVAGEMLGPGEQSATPATQSAPAAAPPALAPSAPVAFGAPVTFTSVSIDVTPPKEPTVAVPPNASAAPRTAGIPPLLTAAVAKPADAMPKAAPASAASAAPVAPAAHATAPAPAPAPASVATPAPVAAAPKPYTFTRLTTPSPVPSAGPGAIAPKPPGPRATPADFDATATDIPDVSSFDFPVLMDAVEETAPRIPVARATVASPNTPPVARTAVAPPPAPRAPTPPPARPTATVPPPMRRLLDPRPVAPSVPPPAPPPAPAPAAKIVEDQDALRQTQTMRAISAAKSINDVSDSMAETLFGEAELDFLSAALASAVDEGEESQAAAASASAPPPTSSPPDELTDLFNLGPDAPLELIDDSAAPQSDRRKSAR